jgi:hypothetical protein
MFDSNQILTSDQLKIITKSGTSLNAIVLFNNSQISPPKIGNVIWKRLFGVTYSAKKLTPSEFIDLSLNENVQKISLE